MSTPSTLEALKDCGTMAERAKRAGKPLDKIERNIISWTLYVAGKEKLSRRAVNAAIMEGERDWDRVLAPIRVVAKFAYFVEVPEEEPVPDFIILESNVPILVKGGNVCPEQFTAIGLKVPKFPKYEKWVKGGKKIYRGKK